MARQQFDRSNEAELVAGAAAVEQAVAPPQGHWRNINEPLVRRVRR